jgi:hypothetical protein
MIDDIIEFVDNEVEECVIIFVDQTKAFDRMEWRRHIIRSGVVGLPF